MFCYCFWFFGTTVSFWSPENSKLTQLIFKCSNDFILSFFLLFPLGQKSFMTMRGKKNIFLFRIEKKSTFFALLEEKPSQKKLQPRSEHKFSGNLQNFVFDRKKDLFLLFCVKIGKTKSSDELFPTDFDFVKEN